MDSPLTPDRPEHYTIRIQGHLTPDWSEWFGEMTIGYPAPGETILSGPVVDQAALHGLLARVRDLNLVLLSVVRRASEPPTRAPEEQP